MANLVLDGAVRFRPEMHEVSQVVSNVTTEVLACISDVPRLTKQPSAKGGKGKDGDKDGGGGRGGGGAKEQRTFFEVVSSERDVVNKLFKINKGMSAGAKALHEWIKYWAKYDELWNHDKDAFIERCADDIVLPL